MNINQAVTNLWSRYATQIDFLNRGACYHELEANRPVLFMGINPSYTGKDGHEMFTLQSEAGIRYFSYYYEFAKAMGLNRIEWTYQDVFYYKWTEQNTIPNDAGDNLFKFKLEHLMLTQSVIELIRPKLIVVCNAEAATYFGVKDSSEQPLKYMGYQFDALEKDGKLKKYILNPDTGCHRILGCRPNLDSGDYDKNFNTNLIGTQIYFTSFTKYQSSIERERTGWHLNQIYKNLGNKNTL